MPSKTIWKSHAYSFFMKNICIAFMLTFLHSPSAKAAPPNPPQKKISIEQAKENLEKETKEKENLKKQIKKIDQKLLSTKKEMIKLAKDIQQNEKNLENTEQKIATLELKESVINDNLISDKASVAKLILALERIERTPPETLITTPNTPYKTAQSALVMSHILPSINRHATKLKRNLETLQTIKTDLKQQKETLSKALSNNKKQEAELSKLAQTRRTLFEKTNSDLKSQELLIQKFSLQAKNLEELIKKIEKENLEEEKRKKAIKTQRKPKTNQSSKILSENTQLPISGIIRVNYQQKENNGAKSNGIKIEGRSGALVTTPLKGKIQFTGAFKRYGKIIIIEHENGYHSLIAGIEKITVSVGAHVTAGEPIAELPNSSFIPRPTLYYELRKNGKPTNPALLFSDLG